MAIVLDIGITPNEIRILQEFRLWSTETLAFEKVNAIRHPSGGAEAPALSLVAKGYLTRDDEVFTLTEKAKAFLAIDAKP